MHVHPYCVYRHLHRRMYIRPAAVFHSLPPSCNHILFVNRLGDVPFKFPVFDFTTRTFTVPLVFASSASGTPPPPPPSEEDVPPAAVPIDTSVLGQEFLEMTAPKFGNDGGAEDGGNSSGGLSACLSACLSVCLFD